MKIKIVQTVSLPFFDLLQALRMGCCSSSLLRGFLDLYKCFMKSTNFFMDQRECRGEHFSPCFKHSSLGPPLQTFSVLHILTALPKSFNSDTATGISWSSWSHAHRVPSQSSPVWNSGHSECRSRQYLESAEDLPSLGFAVCVVLAATSMAEESRSPGEILCMASKPTGMWNTVNI